MKEFTKLFSIRFYFTMIFLQQCTTVQLHASDYGCCNMTLWSHWDAYRHMSAALPRWLHVVVVVIVSFWWRRRSSLRRAARHVNIVIIIKVFLGLVKTDVRRRQDRSRFINCSQVTSRPHTNKYCIHTNQHSQWTTMMTANKYIPRMDLTSSAHKRPLIGP